MFGDSVSLPNKRTFAATVSPRAIHIGAVVLVAIAVIAPTAIWGMPSSRDLLNHFRFALPFYDAVRSGHFYPGWLAGTNNGFGDPSFRFYPPSLYYLLALSRALAGNWYGASLLTFSMISVGGALGMYLWAREFMPSQFAIWAGIFYSLAPYHLNELYQALLLAEFAAAAILPFAFLFTERICRNGRRRDVALLAATYALLILTHLPLAVIGSIALALYAALRMDRGQILRTMFAFLSAVGIGLAASACYWVTMMLELKWIHGNDINPEGGINYRDNFVLSTFSPEFLNVWWMNIVVLFTIAMFWPALILATRTVRRQNCQLTAKAIATVASLLAVTIFMATPLSRTVWNQIHLLQETQFPWRWLSITSMVASLLLAFSIPFWTRLVRTRNRPVVLFALGTVAISLAFSFGHIIREARWLSPTEFDQTLSSLQGSQSIHFWLPAWVAEPLPQMGRLVEAGARPVDIIRWTSEQRTFYVGAGQASAARIKTFFYPHWTARANGRPLVSDRDEQGILRIALPPEAATVEIDFQEPKSTRVATIASALGWLLIVLILMSKPLMKGKDHVVRIFRCTVDAYSS